MTDERRRSPLAHRQALEDASGRITIDEKPFRVMIAVRGDADALDPAIESCCGIPLPRAVGKTTANARCRAIWLAPDEWLIMARDVEADLDPQVVAQATGALHAQVADVTDYYTTIDISGPATRDVLAKLTHYDTHPRAVSAGHAASTLFGHATAIFVMRDDEGGAGAAAELIVRRSLADYLWCLAADGAREFGLATQEPVGKVRLHLPHFEKQSA
ncbi:MAG: sarcosine oxidase subunit gamma family protein [Pseudomonadota bacterium]